MDAHRFSGDLILANRDPRTTETGMLQSLRNEHRQNAQQQKQIVVSIHRGHGPPGYLNHPTRPRFTSKRYAADAHRINQIDALRPIGDIDRTIQVVHEDANDFTKTQRNNRQIITAQLQCGRTE